MESLEIKFVKKASLDSVIRLYREAGWWEPAYDRNPEFLHAVVRDSALFAGAFLNRQMIGMGRALSDLASDAYIQDVAVLKKYRGQGVGKQLIKALITGLRKKGVDWIGLIAEPGTLPFYAELGFRKLEGHIPLKLDL